MLLLYNLIFIGLFILMFHITEGDTKRPNSQLRHDNFYKNKTRVNKEFPLKISQVFSEATNVLTKVIGKMLAKKRIIGMDKGWYW